MLTRILSIGLIAAFATQAQVPQRIKWACIGNSLTAGYPQANLTYVNGTTRLSGLVGYQDTIRNFGVSATTLLKRGDQPYWKSTLSGQNSIGAVFAFKPDIISIELGTNDTKQINWQYSADFVNDYAALIDTLSNNISPAPQIWLILPTPVFTMPPFANNVIRDSVLVNGVIPKIQQVAALKGLKILDMNTPMRAIANSSNFTTYYQTDGIHFTARGSDSVSAFLYRSFLSQVTRVACVGNSITAGSTLTNALQTAYSIRLNMLLGRDYYVRNEGLSGAYMQKLGRSPYWTTTQFKDVFNFKPNYITIMLGTNDSRATQWIGSRYMTDYRAMLDTFSNNISPAPKFFLIKAMPAWYSIGNNSSVVVTPTDTPKWGYDNGITGNGISGFTIRDSVNPNVQQVATERSIPTIDCYTPMLMGQPYNYKVTPSYAPDGVHPKELGHDTLAHVIYRGMLAGGLTTRISKNIAPFSPNNSAKAHLVPVLSGSRQIEGQVYSLDGKNMPQNGTPLPAGTYIVKPVDQVKEKSPANQGR